MDKEIYICAVLPQHSTKIAMLKINYFQHKVYWRMLKTLKTLFKISPGQVFHINFYSNIALSNIFSSIESWFHTVLNTVLNTLLISLLFFQHLVFKTLAFSTTVCYNILYIIIGECCYFPLIHTFGTEVNHELIWGSFWKCKKILPW